MDHESQEAALVEVLKDVGAVRAAGAAVNAVRERKRTSAYCKRATNQKEKDELQ